MPRGKALATVCFPNPSSSFLELFFAILGTSFIGILSDRFLLDFNTEPRNHRNQVSGGVQTLQYVGRSVGCPSCILQPPQILHPEFSIFGSASSKTGVRASEQMFSSLSNISKSESVATKRASRQDANSQVVSRGRLRSIEFSFISSGSHQNH